jgi:4-hydroxybenzoyl-CoA reductase subunit beta
MLLPQHRYLKPESLEDCLAELSEAGETGQIVAGGTDVIFNMRLKLFRPETVISVRRLPELQQVEQLPDGSIRIGASCRLTDLAEHPLIQERFPALIDSIASVASQHIRNMGTLGGNICLQTRCWYTNNSDQWRQGKATCFKTEGDICHVIKSAAGCHAINNADTPIALIAFDASLTIQKSGSQREIPIAEFYNNDGMDHMKLDPDELVTHVTVPPTQDRVVFLKNASRKGIDFSIGSVAARCDGVGDGTGNGDEALKRVMVVLGSLSTAPIVLSEAADIIKEAGLTDAAIEQAIDAVRGDLGEVTNLYSRAVYKKQLARVLVKRALEQLREA